MWKGLIRILKARFISSQLWRAILSYLCGVGGGPQGLKGVWISLTKYLTHASAFMGDPWKRRMRSAKRRWNKGDFMMDLEVSKSKEVY